MARIRTIKPEFFKHEALFDAEAETGLPLRLAFAGLWTQCDREGRFVWRPRQLKTDVLPYDDIDFSRVLDALATRGFVVRYTSAGVDYGYIPSWHKHQIVNNREKASELPNPHEYVEEIDASSTRGGGVDDATRELQSGKGKGKGTGKGKEEEKGAASGEAGPDGPPDPEKDLYDRGKAVLGKSAGGLIRKLVLAKGGNVALARAAIEQASTKSDPGEYIGAIVRGNAAPSDYGDVYRGVL